MRKTIPFPSPSKGEFPLTESFLRTGTEWKRKAFENARIHQMCKVSRKFSVPFCSEQDRVQLFLSVLDGNTRKSFKEPIRFLIFVSFLTSIQQQKQFQSSITPREINSVVDNNIMNMEGSKPLLCKLQLSLYLVPLSL